jgi:sarcosine oxidase
VSTPDGTYDVIVVGLGAMGSASAYALTRAGARGPRVLGIDRFSPPHSLGSSHGQTRIIREAYFEHPIYVPMVRRAFDMWRDLERAIGRPLYTKTRGITLGPEGGMLVSGARAAVEKYLVPHRILSAAGVRRLLPGLQPLDDMVGVLEERAGVLFPEQCISAMLGRAEKAGATLKRGEVVSGWEADDGGVVVQTSAGEYRGAQLVLTGGAWMRQLVPELAPVLSVVRQPIQWFEPTRPDEFAAPKCPVTLWEYAPNRVFYTLPDFGDGVKAGVHYEGEPVDPDQVNRKTTAAEDAQATDLLRRFMPHAKGTLRDSQVCLYTNTPDLHFVVDVHPVHAKRVVVVSACSGHGFKFAPVIGEIVVDLLGGVTPKLDISMFRMGRLTGKGEREKGKGADS